MAVGQSAGAPGQGGGLAVIDGGSAVVTGTTFHSNSTLGSLGIFTGSKGGEAEGGAVYAGPSTNLSLAKDKFTNNSAIAGFGVSAGEADGGAVAFTGAALSVVRDSFNGNIALGGPGITSVGGNARGGAVFIQTGSVKFHTSPASPPGFQAFTTPSRPTSLREAEVIESAGGTALGGAVFDQNGSVKIPFVRQPVQQERCSLRKRRVNNGHPDHLNAHARPASARSILHSLRFRPGPFLFRPRRLRWSFRPGPSRFLLRPRSARW